MKGSIIRVGPQQLEFVGFFLKPTGLVVRGKPSRAEWEKCGQVLHRVEGAVQFWIGDWANYGRATYGDKYAAAVEATGFPSARVTR